MKNPILTPSLRAAASAALLTVSILWPAAARAQGSSASALPALSVATVGASRAEAESLKRARAAVQAKALGTAESDAAVAIALDVGRNDAFTIPGVDLAMVVIRPGEFAMGSANGDADEKPVTQVKLTQPYWLGKYEVTQGQWTAVMGTTPKRQRDKVNPQWPMSGKGANQPMYYVSYDEALAFCRKLTERERSAGRLPEGYVYTLPTEAQWEYACRAGTTGDYAGDLGSMAWYKYNSDYTTHVVGQKQSNAWGLHDMHGNVWEWCRDWYADKLPGGTVIDPVGAASGSVRVLRGGSWWYSAPSCRSAYRGRCGPGGRNDLLGFRLALSAVR